MVGSTRAPDSAAFQTFYVPAKVGIYTTSYPANPPKIVLASNAGIGDLSAAELAGSVYYENDSTKVGYNPNEEHALIKAGRVYALRDDLNITTAGNDYTSEPFVLLAYTSAVDSRPAARTFKVMREDPANGKTFDYSVVAGGQILAPMPLAVEPPPIDPETGDARNVEVEATADSAAHASAPARYASFTIEDRKGYHWVYRGPHANGTPSLGMRFYYAMREEIGRASCRERV